MKKRANAKSYNFMVVPNSERVEWLAKRASKKKSVGAKLKSERVLLANAYAANTGTKAYDLIKANNQSFVVVRNKDTGRLLSKFAVEPRNKKTAVRKLALQPRAGTIGIKKILDAI